MMYICSRCGHQFEDGEERHVKEYMGECHGSPAVVEYSVCPVCGCEEYDKAKECAQCHRFSVDVEDGLCEECRSDTIDCFNRMMADFSIAQRCYLNRVYDADL